MTEPGRRETDVRDVRLGDLQSQVDRRIATDRRELLMVAERLEQALDALDRRLTEALAAEDKRAQVVQRATEQRWDAAQEAIKKSETATDRRLDLLNEFRSQQADEAKKYALREATDARLAEITSRADESRRESLPRETFDQHQRELAAWRDTVNASLAQQVGKETAKTTGTDRTDRWLIAAVGLVVSVVVILVNVFTSVH